MVRGGRVEIGSPIGALVGWNGRRLLSRSCAGGAHGGYSSGTRLWGSAVLVVVGACGRVEWTDMLDRVDLLDLLECCEEGRLEAGIAVDPKGLGI